MVQQSMLSSDQRVIPFRCRKDLVINQSIFQGEWSWVVKDPLAMKYFQIRGPEYEILLMLDGTCSYHDVKHRLAEKFPDQVFKMETIQNLVNSFHKNGLLISDAPGQTFSLRRRRNQELKQKAAGLLSSIIAIRFPGMDPDRFLNWLYPKVRWFFTGWCFLFCLVICLSAMTLVATHFSEFRQRMPEFQQFFGIKNLVFIGVILIFTKSLHELGHGLMCKHFGGECHEIGLMLLVLTPAMYCNTSDSWILPNKWHRIAIGAAGMYVEIVLAAVCTFVWWNTHPGWLHYFCLNVMFVSSVSTILFNANPLLRYDGYYMLSDFLEIPNLSQKSRLSFINRIRVWALGMKPIHKRNLPTRNQAWFAIYSVLAFAYRWFVLILIFWFLTKVFEPYGLEILGQLMIALALAGLFAVPAFKAIKFFLYPGRFREVKKHRAIVSLSVLGIVLAGFCFIPLPHHVWASFVIQPDNAQYVYVHQPGNLVDIKVDVGQQVKAGQVLAVLQNENLKLEQLQLQGKLLELTTDVQNLRLDSFKNVDVARRIGELESEIAKIKRQVRIKNKQIDQLLLRADRDGIVMAAPNRPAQPGDSMTLTTWSGQPTDRENLSALMTRETLFCFVGNPDDVKATLIVKQSDVNLLKRDQQVQLVLNQYRDTRIRGKISQVSNSRLTYVPRELSKSNGGPIPVSPQKDGSELPMINSYEATVPLGHGDSVMLRPGYYGQAKIRVGEASLGYRLVRYLKTVVNFR